MSRTTRRFGRSARLSRIASRCLPIEALESRRLLTALVSGERVLGTIASVGETAEFTFNANVGDSLILSLGELENWSPRLELLAPDNSSLGSVSGSGAANDFNRQIESLNVSQAGTYTAIVSGVTTSTGNFALSLAKLPGAQTFDEGPIVSGQRKLGTLDRGDLDIFTFSANIGDSLILSLGELANWAPRLDVFAPNGTRLDTISGSTAANDFNRQIEVLNAPQSGTYYAVVREASVSTVGDYGLSLARLPVTQTFDEGPIVSGQRKLGALDRGDLDIFTFTASAGDALILSIGELANWAPRLDVFAPNGTRLDTVSGSGAANDFNRQIELLNVTQSGTYYAVVRDASVSATGEYALSLARVPGAQPFDEGPMLSNQRKLGTLDRGDLDVFTFTANFGDSVLLSVGEFANWAPRLDVFAPNGTRLDTISGSTAANDYNRQIDLLALSQGGTYYAVVRDASVSAIGEYALSFAKLPATQSPDTTDNDGGPIASGQTTSGAIAAGDFDVYALPLAIEASATIQMTRLTGAFTSRIDLFAPSGVRLFTQSGSPTATINLVSAPDAGTYYIVARTSSVSAVGNYSIAVDTTPGPDTRAPEVTQSEFRWDVPQQQVVFMLNESIEGSLQVSDMTLLNLTTNVTVPNANKSVTFNTISNQIVFEFPGYPFGALPDGDYRATLNAGSVVDTAGNALVGNHSFEFFFLNGDANRDRRVNLADFNILAANFGQSPRSFSRGDFNYDGQVNLNDFNILAGRFGMTLDGRLASSPGRAPALPLINGLFDDKTAADLLDDINLSDV